MPNYAKTTADVSNENNAYEEKTQVASPDLYYAMRNKYDKYFTVTHDQLGLASTAQTEPLKQWINSIAPTNTKEILEAEKWYQLDYSKKMESALNLYHHDFLPPLQRAVSAGVISQSSMHEWVAWVRNRSRDYKEKEDSIWKELPDYLEKRYTIASKRNAIIGDPRFAHLAHSSDPQLKSLAIKLSDTGYFLNALELENRESLLVDVLNALPLAANEVKIFAGFSAELDKAVSDKLISEGSKKKWIARFKDPSVNIRAKEYFVLSQFPSYVSGWQRIQGERKKVLADPLFSELTTKQCKHLATIQSDSGFLALHFDTQEDALAEARAAIKAHKEGKLLLHKEVKATVEAAAAAGYIGKAKIGAWTEHVLSGKRTHAELKAFIKDWVKVRFRYDQIEKKMLQDRVPQGMQRMTESSFLQMSYAQRLSYVGEAERRLHLQQSEPEDTPIQDMKGKARHALDTETWDEARHFLQRAWPLARSAEDIAELTSMEKHLRAFGTKSEYEENREKAQDEVASSPPTPLPCLPAGRFHAMFLSRRGVHCSQ